MTPTEREGSLSKPLPLSEVSADPQPFAEWVQEASDEQFKKTLAALRRVRWRGQWREEAEDKS